MRYPGYTVDGVPMDAPGWVLTEGTQLRSFPAARSVEVSVPGRAGNLPTTGEQPESTTLGLTWVVTDSDPEGNPGGWDQTEANLESLFALFGRRDRMLDVRFLVSPTVVRQTDAKVVSSAQPERVTPLTASLTVVLTVPGVFWRDPVKTPCSWDGTPHASTSTQAVVPPRRNLATNPTFGTGVARWLASGGVIEWDEAGRRLRYVNDVTAGFGLLVFEEFATAVAPGELVSVSGVVSVDAAAAAAQTFRARVLFYTSAGASASGSVYGPEVTVEPGGTATVTVGGAVTPADGAGARFALYGESPAQAVSYLDDVLVEKAATVGAYFDGDTGDFVSLTGAQLPAPPWTYEVTTLAGSTAPVTDALLLVNGPAVNPRVEDVATGAWLRFDGSLTSTQQLRVDCAGFTAVRGTGIGWDQSGSDVTGLVSNGGPGSGSRWLHLTPVMEGVDPRDRRVRVELSGSGFGAATQLSVRARRAWF